MKSILVCLLALLVGWFIVVNAWGHEDDGKNISNSAPPGIGGSGPFARYNVELISHLPISQIGGGPANVIGNDIWGWTDRTTGREYALFGLTDGTSFIDITDPSKPVYKGKLDTHVGTNNTAWRDIKVYNDHAYIVSDGNNQNHGMQVFDLTQLRNQATEPVSFTETAHYGGFGRAHNIAINEDTGFAYVVGSDQASGGLYMIDLNTPASPTFAGMFSDDGYTHDAQAVTYHGTDSAYFGKEIVFASNEDTLTIVDVSDKSSPNQISRTGYSTSQYTHQGWVSEDHRYFFMDDELDEASASNNGTLNGTRTHIWNIDDLNDPIYIGIHEGEADTIDHNLYVKDDLIFQANYTSGMRVLKIVDAENGVLEEIAFLDTYPTDDAISYNGAWSVFPYFDSDLIIVSDRQNGLFITRLQSVPEPTAGLFGGLVCIAVLFRTRRR